MVHVDRQKDIQNSYSKVDDFYKKHAQDLIYSEETFEYPSTSTSHNVSVTSKSCFVIISCVIIFFQIPFFISLKNTIIAHISVNKL